MQVKIEKKYMTVPVNTSASVKNLAIVQDGKTVYDMDCKIDNICPDFTAYIDVSRFTGATVEVLCDRDIPLNVGFSDTLPSEPERYRPNVHFTVNNGWNNDPNGLIYYRGKYHMFYQYNPCSSQWGTMHWGHAVSEDLIHWQEKDIALYPDELGAMYSGSAIEDVKGVSGITNGENPPMLLYYTAAAGSATRMSKGKKFTQCLAYSFDGEHFEKYSGNPVIEHIEGGNRDPKVVFVEEIGKYVLALYLAENRYCLFTSDDLIHFEKYQDIALAADWECPDIFPLECEGERFWVIMGAKDYYCVGRFTSDGYQTVGTEKRLTQSGVNYAAQTFSGTADRIIKVYWQRTAFPTKRITQQMSIPAQLSLTREDGEYYLHALPVDEIQKGEKTVFEMQNYKTNAPVTVQTGENALDITLSCEYDPKTRLILKAYGFDISVDMRTNEVWVGRCKMPLSLKKDKADVRIIIDRCTAEIYSDGGRYIMADNFICDYNVPYLTLFAANGEMKFESFTVRTVE